MMMKLKETSISSEIGDLNMLAILISLRSRHAIDIFNGEKLQELRKKFPKNYRGWVYIYVCKDKIPVYIPWEFEVEPQEDGTLKALTDFERGNGKVCARFWCDNIDEYYRGFNLEPNPITGIHDSIANSRLIEESCLTYDEICDYSEKNKLSFFAIHISKLELFDKPKSLSDFMPRKWDKCGVKDKNGLYQCHKCPHAIHYGHGFGDCGYAPLKRPPQSWQYVEVNV